MRGGGTAGVGLIVAFGGYALLYYGLTQINSYNFGLLDLIVPSKWATAQNLPKDSK